MALRDCHSERSEESRGRSLGGELMRAFTDIREIPRSARNDKVKMAH
jgi:hypothetical protein